MKPFLRLLLFILFLPAFLFADDYRNFTGFESGSSSGEGQIGSQGSPDMGYAVSPRSGSFSLHSVPNVFDSDSICLGEVNTSSGASQAFTGAAVNDAFISFYFLVNSPPPTNPFQILSIDAGGGNYPACIRLGADSRLRVYNGSICQTLVATGATVLAPATWYAINAHFQKGVAGAYEVQINGVTELSGTMNQNTLDFQCVNFGMQPGTTTEPMDLQYDDIFLSETAYPGSLHVLRAYPKADGNIATWTFGTPPSDFSVVDEAAPDNTDYLECAVIPALKPNFVEIADVADLLILGQIRSVKPYMQVRETLFSPTMTVLSLWNGGPTSANGPIDTAGVTSTRWRLVGQDPATSANWTHGGFDSSEVGVSELNPVAVRGNWLGAMVAFDDVTPTPTPTPTPTFTATFTPTPTLTPTATPRKRDRLPILGVG